MTPYELEQVIHKAKDEVRFDPSNMEEQVYFMLLALLKHEADKAAEARR
jgi:hypothetical protein